MSARRRSSAIALAGALFACGLWLAGCDDMPGKPKPGPEVVDPATVVDFKTLYGQNCAGCHGENGQHGAAIALNSPEYLALVDDATLVNVTANGYKNGLMPGFAKKASGMLTDEQIDAIVHGIRATWGKGNVLAGENPPPYAAGKAGDVEHGGQVYATACANCHGAKGTEGERGSILNGSYLALMNPQSLRTIVIVGRPEWGMPDWRNDVKGHPLTDADVTDVVAWMQAQMPQYPGQPYQQVTPTNHASAPSNGRGEKF